MTDDQNALNHVRTLIEGLNTHLTRAIEVQETAYVSFTYVVSVSVGDQRWRIEFERSIMDDLEVALEKYQGTNYLATLESAIKFRICTELGQHGLLGNFKISKELINDQRDWIRNYQVNLEFDQEMTEILYEGLTKLREFFDALISKHRSLRVGSSGIEQNRKWLDSLISYHETHGNLNSSGVGIRNLQFLKAAAIKQVIDLENMRDTETMRTTWSALNKKIYEIVIELRKSPFLDVQLPEFVHDLTVA